MEGGLQVKDGMTHNKPNSQKKDNKLCRQKTTVNMNAGMIMKGFDVLYQNHGKENGKSPRDTRESLEEWYGITELGGTYIAGGISNDRDYGSKNAVKEDGEGQNDVMGVSECGGYFARTRARMKGTRMGFRKTCRYERGDVCR